MLYLFAIGLFVVWVVALILVEKIPPFPPTGAT